MPTLLRRIDASLKIIFRKYQPSPLRGSVNTITESRNQLLWIFDLSDLRLLRHSGAVLPRLAQAGDYLQNLNTIPVATTGKPNNPIFMPYPAGEADFRYNCQITSAPCRHCQQNDNTPKYTFDAAIFRGL